MILIIISEHQHVLLELVYFHNREPAAIQSTHRETERQREALLLPIFAASSSQALGGFRICLCLRWTTTQTSSKIPQNPQFFVVVVKPFFSLTEEVEEEEEDRKNRQTLLSEIMNQANGFFWNCNNKQTDRQTPTYISLASSTFSNKQNPQKNTNRPYLQQQQ